VQNWPFQLIEKTVTYAMQCSLYNSTLSQGAAAKDGSEVADRFDCG
jgi:hypothetical protein